MTAIIVDTNVIFNNQLNRLLSQKVRDGALTVYVPTLVHAERIRQVADEKGLTFSIDFFRQAVALTGFTLIDLTQEDAEAVAALWLELRDKGQTETYWKAHRFDILLCAIARTRGYTLITDDEGTHFQLVVRRQSSVELQQWLMQP